MQICKLTIKTTIDEQENTISRMGRLKLLNGSVLIDYKEENAQVHLLVNKNSAKVERIGDYSLRLYLIPNQITEGSIGIAGNEGKLSVDTSLVACERMERRVEIHLRYRLLFGEESQTMKLSLIAQTKGDIDEKDE